MAKIELRLSSKVQTETGMCEILIRFVNGKSFDLYSGSEVFVKPEYFEYYIDRIKTEKAGVCIDGNVITATTALADKKGYILRKSGIITIRKRIETEEVIYHRKQEENINKLKEHIIKKYNESDKNLSSDWLKVIVEKYNHPDRFNVETRQRTFAELAEEYYTIPHGGRLTPLSYDQQRAYKVLIRTVARYAGFVRANGRKTFTFDINTVTRKDIEDFADYLSTEKDKAEQYPKLFEKLLKENPISIGESRSVLKGRGENTVKNMLDRLKSLFRYFYDKGYTTNRPFDGYKIGAEQYGTPVYISIEERNRIADADLETIWDSMSIDERKTARTPLKTLIVMRDIFIGQCFLGCRVGDLAKLTEKHIVDGVLRYTPTKTLKESGESAIVPLHPKVMALIEKYRGVDAKGRLFPVISPNKYNIALKVIFRMAGVTRPVEITNSKTGEKEIVTIDTIASSHMARRTFVGNLYFKVQDPNLISKMSGHVEGSKAFARYRKIEVETLKGVINELG
jgi:site-specific recombinase XerD